MKLTDEYIAAQVVKDEVYKVGAKTTLVVLTLKNGFEVIGTSACVDAAAYDQELGATYARATALKKVWELEGYLSQTFSETKKSMSTAGSCCGSDCTTSETASLSTLSDEK